MNFQTELLCSLRSHGHKTAIETDNTVTSYAQILSAANKVSSYLLNLGLEKETIVGIDVKDKTGLIAAIIGIINARCVFVVLDDKLPQTRLDAMIQNMELQHVISQGNSLIDIAGKYEVINSHQFDNIISTISVAEADTITYPEYEADDSLYIYFTSGSTGMPKGIVGRNCSLLQFVQWEIEAFDIDENSRFSQFISPYFDAFMRDIFVPLMAGATICIPPDDEDFYSSEKLVSWIEDTKITLIHCVPSLFRLINTDTLTSNHFFSLKYILMSGEKINPTELAKWYEKFQDKIQLFNLYGTTETTMIRTCYKITPGDARRARIPIGTPINDTEILVADKNLKPTKMLVPGDLYIISNYVTKGYLDDEKLNAEKFIKIRTGTPQETIAFKTGDKARILPGGKIELIGREDRQVKIRGIRVELDEIEISLQSSEWIKNVLVLVHSDENKNDLLIAFVIRKTGLPQDLDVKEKIWHYAQAKLPDYMVPSKVIEVEEFPLLTNGKINYKGLLEHLNTEKEVLQPKTKVEEEILLIWKDILGDKPISTDDKFHHIGGNSLTIMSLISRINNKFNVRIALSELFQNPTISQQAVYISQTNNDQQVVIPVASPSGHYKLSLQQRRLYFLYEFDKTLLAYNMPQVVRLFGVLDVAHLEKTINRLIERHESLRTCFVLIDGDPVLKVLPKASVSLEILRSEEVPMKSVVDEFIRPFALGKAPLMRVGLQQVSNEEHIMMFDMHHIISDGMSQAILIKDFMALYHNDTLPPLKIQYKDFAEWQHGQEQQNQMAKLRQFWLECLNEVPQAIQLPADFPRPQVKGYEGDRESFILNEDETKKLKTIAKDENATLFMLLLAIYNILLAKLSQQRDIIIGTPVAGRQHVDLEGVIGLFVNMLPLRNYPGMDMTFKAFLQTVKSNVLSSFDHQDYPLEAILDDLEMERDMSRNPLFDFVFSFQNFEETVLKIPNLKLEPFARKHTQSKFDMNLFAVEKEGKIIFNVEYATGIFSQQRIKSFINYFKSIVSAISQNTDILLTDIGIIPGPERNDLLTSLDNTCVKYPADKTLVDLFKEQVDKTPTNIALKKDDQTMSYEALEQLTDKLALLLVNQGVQSNDIVGLLMDRSIETIVGMLAILKAGGAYMPIDVEYPRERIRFMLEDSGAKLVLTSKAFRHDIDGDYKLLFVEDASEATGKLEYNGAPNDLCYIIYTSGTTGTPKGVMVEHKNVVRLFFNDQPLFDFGPSDVWTMFHSHCFDFSVWEIYGALLFGGKLVVISNDQAIDTPGFLPLLRKEKVTILNQTPTAFYNLLHEEASAPAALADLRYVIFGGEALAPGRLKSWNIKYPHVKLINMYGITETTVHVTFKEIGKNEIQHNISNIGRPIPTLKAYVLDAHLKPVPQGVLGELFIGGEGVARGYLGKEDLTKDKFIQSPFHQGERLYRTGDVVRMQANSELEYIGRNDRQIQLRGFRIELGEIENKLLALTDILEASIQQRKVNKEDSLIGYYRSVHPVNEAKIRKHLLESLPAYMLPSYFVRLEKFPLTSNGKLDHSVLPQPGMIPGEDYVAPVSEVEQKLVEIWSEVLGIEKALISVDKSFFEMGGNSLKVVKLKTMINEAFDLDISIPDMFRYTTIWSLSEFAFGKKTNSERNDKEVEAEMAGMRNTLKLIDD